MTEDKKSETGQEVQETGQTVHHHQQQPSLKDTGSGSPRSQNEPYFDDSPTSTKPTRTQVARETIETYNNYRNKRKTKDHNWWGSKHHEPERGDPIVNFRKPDPLDPHLRPTTPPMEKAEKQNKGLEDQGVNVTPELREEVTHQNPLVTKQDVYQLALYTDMSKAEEEKEDLEDSSMQYNKHSIPPPPTVKLPRTPLNSVREASESSQSSPLSPVTKESLEKKPWSVKAAQSHATQDDACRNRVKELELQVQNLKEELRASNDSIRVQGKANYITVDSLINAVRKENKGTDEEEAPNLVDRINYLNLVCFFRTRNYLQLALREGDHTLARILLNDADKWVKSCKEYFETMDPEVNRQIKGSILILHGMRKVLTTKDEGILIEGIKYVKHGRGELNKLPKSDSFAQLVQLADSILQATKYDEEQNSLGIKRLPFNPFGWKNKRQYAKIQGTIKDDPAMKAEALRLTGVHSPLSPHKWRKDNWGEGFEPGEYIE
ncbi:hypothetical protein FOC1_g10012824 [Fusarium oxysporum f. sp. cubense race 1]|uniref:Uncharacterized protein n=1 Tax=Fusarium oxysporum f. sp. cubense (strain race 1) TaxID=1229664 RepID=N4TJ32_FUSC1|nr:hypothetical protein FOC1_g10012824 [Fusarium oxysporum f. sp. cubense race 1]